MPKNSKRKNVILVRTKQQNGGREFARYLWRKENFACVRIFYCCSRRKTEDLDIARIRSRTDS
jgi:hypothetical protein